VTVVFLDNGIEQFGELGVGIVRTSVETNARIEVLDTRENAGLEGNSRFIALILILLPDLFGEMLGEKRLSSGGEESIEILKLISGFKL
jgi:hypothetical protein